MKIKIRPAILLGELVLGGIAVVAILFEAKDIAGVAAGGICATLPKLVESEEKSGKEEEEIGKKQ